MKNKVFWVLIPLLLTTIIHAQEIKNGQTNPYRYFVGGTTVLEMSEMNNDFSVLINVEPKIGIIISQKFLAGLKIGLTYMDNFPYATLNEGMSTEAGTPVYLEVHLINDGYLVNISPFIRYQNNLIGKLKYCIEPGFGVELIFGSPKYYGYLNCGFQFLISQKMGFELQVLSLKYSELHVKGIEPKFSEFTTDYIFSNPNIGIVFYLQ
jgi:hypothetical protein